MIGYTKPCCRPLQPTPIHFHSLLTHFHSFSAHSHPLPLMFSPLVLILSPYSNTLIQSNPPPTIPTHLVPIFSPCILRAYVVYVPVCLCVFVLHVPTCLWNSFLCTLLPVSIYFTCFCVCSYVSPIYLHCVF